MHTKESTLVLNCLFHLLDAFLGLLGITGANVAVEFDDHSVADRLFEPFHDVLLKPRTRFFVQGDIQRGMPGTGVRIVGEDNPFEFECNHAVARVVGNKETARCIVQIIGVKCPMFRNGRFDSQVLGRQSWRGIQGRIQSRHASQRRAVERDIDWTRVRAIRSRGGIVVHGFIRLLCKGSV